MVEDRSSDLFISWAVKHGSKGSRIMRITSSFFVTIILYGLVVTASAQITEELPADSITPAQYTALRDTLETKPDWHIMLLRNRLVIPLADYLRAVHWSRLPDSSEVRLQLQLLVGIEPIDRLTTGTAVIDWSGRYAAFDRNLSTEQQRQPLVVRRATNDPDGISAPAVVFFFQSFEVPTGPLAGKGEILTMRLSGLAAQMLFDDFDQVIDGRKPNDNRVDLFESIALGARSHTEDVEHWTAQDEHYRLRLGVDRGTIRALKVEVDAMLALQDLFILRLQRDVVSAASRAVSDPNQRGKWLAIEFQARQLLDYHQKYQGIYVDEWLRIYVDALGNG